MSGRRPREEPQAKESQLQEAGLEELLREAGSRVTPPPDMTSEVYASVHAEWRGIVAQRRRRRGRMLAAAASVAMAVGLAVFMAAQFGRAPPAALASAARIVGEVTRSTGEMRAGQALAAGDPMYAADEVVTGAEGRASLDLGAGLSVRVDGNSRVRLAGADRLELVRGAVYVDADPTTAPAAGLMIGTSVGPVRHQGTQYEVRDVGNAIRISVREGRVVFGDRGATHVGAAGEQLLVHADGEVARGPVPPGDARWEWAVRIAPPFEIENQPLGAFLVWAARETGHRIEFASPAAQRVAETTVLRGSIAGLDPAAAFEAVLATTDLRIAHRDTRRIRLSLE